MCSFGVDACYCSWWSHDGFSPGDYYDLGGCCVDQLTSPLQIGRMVVVMVVVLTMVIIQVVMVVNTIVVVMVMVPKMVM